MIMRYFSYTFFALILYSCAAEKVAEPTPAAAIIEQLKAEYAPDKRVARWFIQDTFEEDQVVLRGETNLPEAKSALLEQLEQQGVAFLDSIELLPSSSPRMGRI